MEENSKEIEIIHLPSNQFVQPVYYDRISSEVSYIPKNSKSVFTCFDYELMSKKGLNHLRTILNDLSSTNSNNLKKDFIIINDRELNQDIMI